MGPNRNEWQKRCTFNGFCKKVLKNEAIDAIRRDFPTEQPSDQHRAGKQV